MGVIYLEKGLNTVCSFVEQIWEPFLHEKVMATKDAKTMLQEWAQKNKGIVPVYTVLSKTGPDHRKIYSYP